ncbi:MAG: transporter [Verrucomicrobia bacterium]|nr:transporter [Verrucomicrobiota bacterium]
MDFTLLRSVVLFPALVVIGAHAEDLTNEAEYTLLNPTPTAQLRSWHTDNAGASPYTIDAGHYEVNVDMDYGYLRREGSTGASTWTGTIEKWVYGGMTLKAGLLKNLDAEVSIVPYETMTGTLDGAKPAYHARDTQSGFGDTAARLKFNVWGNDGGSTALSVSAHAKFPTAEVPLGNGLFEAGPALEFAAQMLCGFELRVDSFVELDKTHGWNAAFENLVSVSHPLVGKLEGFCIFDTWTFTTSVNWQAVVVPGLNWRLKDNVELSTSVAFGLNGNGFQYMPSLGVSVRF